MLTSVTDLPGPRAKTPPDETLLRSGGGFKPRLRSRKLRIEFVSGPDAPAIIEHSGPELDVGTAQTCHLLLTDPTVSRHHFKLRVEGDDIRIKDAGSRNGKYVDSVRIADAWARPDSQIACGDTVLGLRLLEDLIELPLSSRSRFGALHGESTRMRQLFAMLERVAVSDTTVRIEGETDTGKELAAEALNDHSGRASGPIIVFDCSAVTTHLIESALFGYVVGVFTGAVSVRQGAFEAVDGGTLFLDEVGEPPIELQPKLLRALEQLTIRRVDANDSHQVDVRIVAATNRSLAAEVDAGRFREDLYYRLAVVKLELPPLRERLTDVPLLASRFASAIAKREGIDAELPEDLIRRWQTEAWPGNVRELRNSVARAISMRPETYRMSASRSAPKTPAIDLSVPLKLARDHITEQFEREYISAAHAETGGNVTRAAELAGVHRKFIHWAIAKYRLRADTESG